jgi:hypothetical protein
MGDDVVHRVVAESWRGIFRHLSFALFRSRGGNVSDALTRRKGA